MQMRLGKRKKFFKACVNISTDARVLDLQWLCEQNLVQKLVAMIDPSEPEEVS